MAAELESVGQSEANGYLPEGNLISLPIRSDQVEITEGAAEPTMFDDDAAATLVYANYQRAKNHVENNSWLLEWQTADILYQSPTIDRWGPGGESPYHRVSRHIVAKNTNTMARQVKRVIFADQNPFLLRPRRGTTQRVLDAWTAILSALLKRMNFKYHASLLIDCQTLQGTGIGKLGVETRTVIKKKRVRKGEPTVVDMPLGGSKHINDQESDEFTVVPQEVTETWPFFEFRALGTTLFDPKWNTPNRPDLSGSYIIDIDFPVFEDLQIMRQQECYKGIPDDETLKAYFLRTIESNAPAGTAVEDSMSGMGSPVEHAEGRNQQTSANPFDQPFLLIEEWSERTVRAILCYDGKILTIRNEEKTLPPEHVTANWYNVTNSGYGIGIGRLNSSDQRINQGILNEALKMIAYPMNAPLLIPRGENTPTQNVLSRLGGFWQVDVRPGDDVRRAAAFMEMPAVPGDAWKMLQYSQESAEDSSGANSAFMQGNLTGPRSSAARTATGAGRIASKADETISDPVDAIAEGVVIPTLNYLIAIVKERMPLTEIREMLKDEDAQIILNEVEEEQFKNAAFEIDILAGQRLQAKQGILQVLPVYSQMLEQPQWMQYLHERGETIDISVIFDLLKQLSELHDQDDIVRKLTPEEQQQMKDAAQAANKVQAQLQLEQAKGQNKIQEIHAKSQDELANMVTEKTIDHAIGSGAFVRAAGQVTRDQDRDFYRGDTE